MMGVLGSVLRLLLRREGSLRARSFDNAANLCYACGLSSLADAMSGNWHNISTD